MLNFFKSIVSRVAGNRTTTVGGGVFGVAIAAAIGYLEELTGCKFAVAFGNLDYAQLIGFTISQVFGALMTDANKSLSVSTETHKTVITEHAKESTPAS